MHVEVNAPDQYSGDIMGDLSSRRGRISGSEARGSSVVIKAQVPFAEMLNYATDADLHDAGSRQLLAWNSHTTTTCPMKSRKK